MRMRSLRRTIARLISRRRLRDLRRRADWVAQARNTPTLERGTMRQVRRDGQPAGTDPV